MTDETTAHARPRREANGYHKRPGTMMRFRPDVAAALEADARATGRSKIGIVEALLEWELLTTDESKLAWAAGFIDGDGCIRWCAGHVHLQVDQVDQEPLRRLRSLFGGSLLPTRRTTAGNQLWRWSVTGRAAEDIIEQIRPWLAPAKAAKADVALSRQGVST